ncbi:MAG: hypothetical protein MUE42_13735 [Opitutaceae bacterium]|nr:hypothetical protein [Opitutaceae bacterium]
MARNAQISGRRAPSACARPWLAGSLAVAALVLGACASTDGAKRAGRRGHVAPAPADTAPRFAPGLVELGRIRSFDAAGQVAVVELSPFTSAPPASKYRSSSMIGAYVTSGVPRADDEVVIAPAP